MIDYLMKKYGYSKEKEDKFGVRYVKTEKQNFEHTPPDFYCGFGERKNDEMS